MNLTCCHYLLPTSRIAEATVYRIACCLIKHSGILTAIINHYHRPFKSWLSKNDEEAIHDQILKKGMLCALVLIKAFGTVFLSISVGQALVSAAFYMNSVGEHLPD